MDTFQSMCISHKASSSHDSNYFDANKDQNQSIQMRQFVLQIRWIIINKII